MKIIKLTLFIFFISLSNFYPQWTQLNSGTNNYLLSIFFVNHNIGFVAGKDSTISKNDRWGYNLE